MSIFRSLCIAVVFFSLAGCDKLASVAGVDEAGIAGKIYQSKTEEEAFERIRQFAVGTWSSTEAGEIWWRLDVPSGGRTMTVYMVDPTSNDWGEGITDELEPFQSKWSDTGQLMFGFKTKNGALRFVVGPDGKLAHWDNDEKRFYGLHKGDSSNFTAPLPTQEARGELQAEAAPSKCDLIAQREVDTRRQCDSGNFNACRDIAGWVANKVMEGCSSGNISPQQKLHDECLELAKSSLLANGYCMGGRGDKDSCDYLTKAAREAAQKGCSPSIVDEAREQMALQSGQSISNSRQALPAEDSDLVSEQAQHEPTIDITSKNMNPPRYPPAAFRAGVQGEVGLVVDVDANGNVTNVAVEKSSRNRDLDRAAMEAARKWRFNAAKSSSGVPMAGRIRVPVTFALDGGESSNGVPEESTSSIGFKSIRDAIAELWAHSDYANLRETDFSRIDVARGIAEVDASTQMYLPPGSTDTLVTYYEGNSGLHELIAYRYDGKQWRDISREVLPGYQADASRFRGTNYYLDGAGGTVKVRSLPAKKAWRYSGGRFVQEG